MKPIFTEEKMFFEKYLNITLPENCWREDNSIYLNLDENTLLINYDFTLGVEKVTYDNIDDVLKNHRNLSWEEEIEKNLFHLQKIEKESIDRTVDFIKKTKLTKFDQISFFEESTNPKYAIPYRVSYSGGKDSVVTYAICKEAFDICDIQQYSIDYFATGSDTADTTSLVKSLPSEHLVTTIPELGFYLFFKIKKNFYIPSVTKRLCCDYYKESAIHKILNPSYDYILFTGVRNTESNKRAYLDYEINKAFIEKEKLKQDIAIKKGKKCKSKKLNVRKNWHRFAPIVNWTETDVWLYILWKKLNFNNMYKKGYTRVGCLHCPFQRDIVDVLNREFYPCQTKIWNDLLTQNYIHKRVEKRLKWTLEEWLNGKWKQGMSKEQELVKKHTPENVKKFAEFKNIPIDVAEKYFIKKCVDCNKKVNPTDTAMSLKFIGRKQSSIYCEKCFKNKLNLSTKEYKEMLYMAREDCDLF